MAAPSARRAGDKEALCSGHSPILPVAGQTLAHHFKGAARAAV